MIGPSIFRSRQKKKITQQKLAEKIGISQAYLSRIESGEKKLPLHLGLKISTILDDHDLSVLLIAHQMLDVDGIILDKKSEKNVLLFQYSDMSISCLEMVRKSLENYPEKSPYLKHLDAMVLAQIEMMIVTLETLKSCDF